MVEEMSDESNWRDNDKRIGILNEVNIKKKMKINEGKVKGKNIFGIIDKDE
jgi:hypothetical protein